MASKELTIVSGIQPTGSLHIGNWAGSVRNWVRLQNEHPGECWFFIADYHALATDYDTKEQQHRILDLAASLLALGIDSKKSTLFVQSDVPEHTELCWILNCVTPVAEMERMTQFKDKTQRLVVADKKERPINNEVIIKALQEQSVVSTNKEGLALVRRIIDELRLKDAKRLTSMGLLDYPVLQAADILLYGGNAVPVGQDQVQHVETTRVIARNFNKRFGSIFPEPKEILNETPKVMSLTEPTKKMSKSHGEKSYIALDDELEVILQKIKRVPTEPTGRVHPHLFDLVTNPKIDPYFEQALEDSAQKNLLMGNQGFVNMLMLLRLCWDYDKKTSSRNELISANMNNFRNQLAHPLEGIRYGEFKKFVAEIVADKFADYRAKKKELLKNPDRIRMVLASGGAKARAHAKETMATVLKATGLR